MKNPGIVNRGSIVPGVRQLLPTVYSELLQDYKTPYRAHKEGGWQRMGLEPAGRISLSGTQVPLYYSSNPGPL